MIKEVFFRIKERLMQIGLFKTIVLFLTFIMLITVAVLGIVLQVGKNSLEDQLMAKRWSIKKDVAQISCFYSQDAFMTEDSIEEMRYLLSKKLQELAIEPNTANARLYIDAYSAQGTISIQSDKKSIQATAIGIGGDFFMFHPVKLKGGMYFSGNDLMQDAILLDEEAAWQLFGSNDIAGKTVTIGGLPYRVAGVYERPQGDLETLAGSEDTTVYVSFSTLNAMTSASVTCYEVVMPNPVEGFAMDRMLEINLSSEEMVKMVENSNRFSYISLYNVWKERAARSMKTDDIVLPFWENLARYKEEQMMEVALWQVVFAGILLIYWGIKGMIWVIRHKPTAQTFVKIGDFISEKFRGAKKRAKAKRNARKELEQNTYIDE